MDDVPYRPLLEEIRKYVEAEPAFKKFGCVYASAVVKQVLGLPRVSGQYFRDGNYICWQFWNYDHARKLYVDIAHDTARGGVPTINLVPDTDERYKLMHISDTIQEDLQQEVNKVASKFSK